MYRIRCHVNDKTLKMVYYSLLYPHLLYGIPIWGNADETHLNSLTKLQKHNNIQTTFLLPGNPVTYCYIDTFKKEPSSLENT